MNRAKYIIVEYMGHELPIVFSSLISHFDIGKNNSFRKVISAGFCEVMGEETEKDEDNISVWAGGRSTSLKDDKDNYVVSRGEKDAVLIQRMLRNQHTWG